MIWPYVLAVSGPILIVVAVIGLPESQENLGLLVTGWGLLILSSIVFLGKKS